MPPIVRGIYKEVFYHMDMPLKCPVEPVRRIIFISKELLKQLLLNPVCQGNYSILGAGVSEEEFPPYIPLASYRLIVRVYQPREDPYSLLCGIKMNVDVIKNNESRPPMSVKKRA